MSFFLFIGRKPIKAIEGNHGDLEGNNQVVKSVVNPPLIVVTQLSPKLHNDTFGADTPQSAQAEIFHAGCRFSSEQIVIAKGLCAIVTDDAPTVLSLLLYRTKEAPLMIAQMMAGEEIVFKKTYKSIKSINNASRIDYGGYHICAVTSWYFLHKATF